MKRKREYQLIMIILFFMIVMFPAAAQETGTGNTGQSPLQDFILLPILETLFSQNVGWRPDWPADIPPDAFIIPETNGRYEAIELSNGIDIFSVRYDRVGRLLEFPVFYSDSYAVINAEYNEVNALLGMNITIKNYSSSDGNDQSEEKTISVIFPEDFYPFSQMSPGGAFPPLSVNIDDAYYHVFIFESPVMLTETWYNEEGNILLFCKASVDTDKGKWRIRSMEIQNTAGAYLTDYFFDSYGNITEIKIIDGVFLSLYKENIPSYWRNNDQKFELFWDTQNVLTRIKASEFIDEIYTEYRYEYDFDRYGNWIKRQETAYIMNSNLLVPNPSYSRSVWNRRVGFFD